MNFCSRFLRLSVVPRCRERPQIAMCFLEWLGRLKWRATGLDASLSFFSTSRRCSRNRSPSLLPVSPMYNLLHNLCGGICEAIGDLNRSLRSRYLASVNNEKTSFAFREHLRDVEKNDKDASKPVARHFNLPNHSKKHMAICGLSLHLGTTESRKNLEQKFIFQIGTLNPHGINEHFSFN